MNNIPRGTKVITLLNYLLEPRTGPFEAVAGATSHADVHCGTIITDSRLDDELSVATIEFGNTPIWLQYLRDDPYGFPKKTPSGTLWEGVDRETLDLDGRTAFIRAVMRGEDPLFVEMLAEFRDTDVNIQDTSGMTALHWACTIENPSMVQLCLSVPDLATGIRDNNGHTAFDIAARSGRELITDEFYRSIFEMEEHAPQAALLRALTISSERNDAAPVFAGIALFDPVETSNEPLVVALIARGVELTTKNDHGDTALHVAAQKGNVEILKALHGAGSDINAGGNGGATPLHYAAVSGDTKMVVAILVAGGDSAIEDHDGNLASGLAVENKHFGIAQMLKTNQTDVISKSKPPSPTLVQQAEDTENLGDIQLAEDEPDDDYQLQSEKPHRGVADGSRGLQYGAEGDDQQRLHALFQVALSRESQHVLALYDLAANVGPANGHPSGKALPLAVRCGNLYMCEVLLGLGADVNLFHWQFGPVLHTAVDTGETAMVRLLLTSGAKIDAVDTEGWTALHKAASCDFKQILVGGSVDKSNITANDLGTEMVSILVAADANVNAACYGGDTALHIAARAGHLNIVILLLDNGALTEAYGEDRYTALHCASKAGHASVVRQLLLKGAQIEARARIGISFRGVDEARMWAEKVWPTRTSASGVTALHLAVRHGQVEIVGILLAKGASFKSRSVDGTPREQLEDGNSEIVAMLDRAERDHEAGTDIPSPRLLYVLRSCWNSQSQIWLSSITAIVESAGMGVLGCVVGRRGGFVGGRCWGARGVCVAGCCL